jgi:hypothetical protein
VRFNFFGVFSLLSKDESFVFNKKDDERNNFGCDEKQFDLFLVDNFMGMKLLNDILIL